MVPEYKDVHDKLKNQIFLNDYDKKVLRKINTYIDDVLLDSCESGKYSKEEFIQHIHDSL